MAVEGRDPLIWKHNGARLDGSIRQNEITLMAVRAVEDGDDLPSWHWIGEKGYKHTLTTGTELPACGGSPNSCGNYYRGPISLVPALGLIILASLSQCYSSQARSIRKCEFWVCMGAQTIAGVLPYIFLIPAFEYFLPGTSSTRIKFSRTPELICTLCNILGLSERWNSEFGDTKKVRHQEQGRNCISIYEEKWVK